MARWWGGYSEWAALSEGWGCEKAESVGLAEWGGRGGLRLYGLFAGEGAGAERPAVCVCVYVCVCVCLCVCVCV